MLEPDGRQVGPNKVGNHGKRRRLEPQGMRDRAIRQVERVDDARPLDANPAWIDILRFFGDAETPDQVCRHHALLVGEVAQIDQQPRRPVRENPVLASCGLTI